VLTRLDFFRRATSPSLGWRLKLGHRGIAGIAPPIAYCIDHHSQLLCPIERDLSQLQARKLALQNGHFLHFCVDRFVLTPTRRRHFAAGAPTSGASGAS
jgi:hypothetical protein